MIKYKTILLQCFFISTHLIMIGCQTSDSNYTILGDWQFFNDKGNYVEIAIDSNNIHWWSEDGFHDFGAYSINDNVITVETKYFNFLTRDSTFEWKVSFQNENSLQIDLKNFTITPKPNNILDTLIYDVQFQASKIPCNEFTFTDVKTWGGFDKEKRHHVPTPQEKQFRQAFSTRKKLFYTKYNLYNPSKKDWNSHGTIIIK